MFPTMTLRLATMARLAAIAAAGLPAAALVPTTAIADTRPVDLAAFFSGHLRATGQVRTFSDGVTRGVKVDIHGGSAGNQFRIQMNTTYSDGKRERKVWTFQSLGNGRYVGRRADLVGTATVVAEGSRITMNYVAKVQAPKGGAFNVAFNETYQFSSPGKGTNSVHASVLSIPVGEGNLVIRKLPN